MVLLAVLTPMTLSSPSSSQVFLPLIGQVFIDQLAPPSLAAIKSLKAIPLSYQSSLLSAKAADQSCASTLNLEITMAPLLSSPGRDMAKLFSRTLATPTINPPLLVPRQDAPAATVTVVADSDDGCSQGLSGGAIAGIVIGTIVGTLLLLWIIRSCFNLGVPPSDREKWYSSDPPKRRHRSRSSRRTSSMSMPPPVVIRDSRSQSRHRHPSPRYVYTESDRGRGGYR